MAGALAARPASAVEVFVAIDPCRVYDTRADQDLVPGGGLDNDAPSMPEAPAQRVALIAGHPERCLDIAPAASAVAASIVVVNPQTRGFLSTFPEDGGFIGTSWTNFSRWAGDTANPVDAEFALQVGGVLPLDDDGEIGMLWVATKNPPDVPSPVIDLAIDVTGYFIELTSDDGITLTGDGPVVIGLDANYQLPQSCGTGEVPSWDGDSWECAAVAAGDVTDVFVVGPALTVQNSGGPQPTISLAAAFTLPSNCESDDVPVWDGDSWECVELPDGGAGPGAVVVSHAARHNQLNTSAGATTYGPAGASNPTDVQATDPAAQRIEILSPESGCVAQRMRVRQVDPTDADPVLMDAGQTRTFRLMVGGAASDLSCTIPSGDSTCLSTNTHAIDPGGLRLSIRETNNGSGTFPTADALITWECVVAP